MPGQETRLLIVEDEVRLAESLRRGLIGDGYLVDVVHDGASALTALLDGLHEIVILDRDLPILHGDIVARTLRDTGSPARVIMLTAASETADQVAGLDLGRSASLQAVVPRSSCSTPTMARRSSRPSPSPAKWSDGATSSSCAYGSLERKGTSSGATDGMRRSSIVSIHAATFMWFSARKWDVCGGVGISRMSRSSFDKAGSSARTVSRAATANLPCTSSIDPQAAIACGMSADTWVATTASQRAKSSGPKSRSI